MPSLLQAWALPAALMGIGHVTTTWYNVVSKEVPEPYLVSDSRHLIKQNTNRTVG